MEKNKTCSEPMQTPKSVRITGIDWTITVCDLDLVEANNYGETLEHNFEIRITGLHKDQRQRATLLHELLHATQVSTISPRKRLSEDQIKHLGGVLYSMMRDSPDVFRWLLDDSKEA